MDQNQFQNLLIIGHDFSLNIEPSKDQVDLNHLITKCLPVR